MLPQNKIKLIRTLVLFGLGLFSVDAFSQNNENFRTPAKLYAGAYSVKVQLRKGFTEYDVSFWIKPDQAESTIDQALLKDLGYVDKEIIFDEVKISGERLEKKKFKNLKSEWAFVPDFAKSCCFGVIGRDILQDFAIRFNPASPTHLEWDRIITKENSEPYTATYLKLLKRLFSLEQTLDVPFVLNLQERKLDFEGKLIPEKKSLFKFFFVPPERVIRVTEILTNDKVAAKKVGFVPGLVITHINGEKVSGLDRWVIEKYLRGEKGAALMFTSKAKKEFEFNFKDRQFK